jgi:hypothetical protein
MARQREKMVKTTVRRRLKRPVPITRVLDETLRHLGVGVKLNQHRVWSLWGEVVGPAISAHAQPSSIHGGRLFVAVEDSLWLHQLNYLRHRVLEELNSRLGKAALKEMVLRVGEVKPPTPSRSLDRPLPLPSSLAPQDQEKMEEILSPVKELPCREVLERVLLLHFCRKESSP